MSDYDRILCVHLEAFPGKTMDLRQSIDNQTRLLIDEETARIPEGKRGALLVIAHQDGAQLHVAGLVYEGKRWVWKVAGAGGVTWDGKVDGRVAIIGAW